MEIGHSSGTFLQALVNLEPEVKVALIDLRIMPVMGESKNTLK